jgi:hypothetical protein
MAETDYSRLIGGDTEQRGRAAGRHLFSDWMTRNVLALAPYRRPGLL